MNLCIIGPKDLPETIQLKAQAEELGYSCKRISLLDIYIEIKANELSVKHRKIELLDFDVFIFRSIKANPANAVLLAKYLKQRGKTVIDEALTEDIPSPDLFSFKLAEVNLPQIERIRTISLKAARDVLMEIEHPILIKYTDDNNKTKITFSEEWTDGYDLVRTTKNRNFLFQKYLPTKSYYHVLVVGKQIVCGLEKISRNSIAKLNYSEKLETSCVELPDAVKTLAIQAVSVLKINIAAVLIALDGESPTIIDVIRAPKFTNIQKEFNVNIAKEILQYAASY